MGHSDQLLSGLPSEIDPYSEQASTASTLQGSSLTPEASQTTPEISLQFSRNPRVRSRHSFEQLTVHDLSLIPSSLVQRQQPRKRQRTSGPHNSNLDNLSESGSRSAYTPSGTRAEDWTEAMRLTQPPDGLDARSTSPELQNAVSNGATGALDVSGILYSCLLPLCYGQ